MRILIVEDDNDVATSLYEFLEKCGYIVDAAADGVTGLHLATVGTFDAIVLDVALPGPGRPRTEPAPSRSRSKDDTGLDADRARVP